MSNSRCGRSTRKVDHWEVYDALPAPIRAALQEGPQEWDAVWARARLRHHLRVYPDMERAIGRVVNMLNEAHASEIRDARPWQARQRFVKAKRIPSPHMLANATMQTSGRMAP